MQTAKQEALAAINALPDEATFEEIQYRLYVLEAHPRRAGRARCRRGHPARGGESPSSPGGSTTDLVAARSPANLREILDHVAADSPGNARAVARRFFARVESLPDQPGQGRRVPEYEGADDLREVFVQRWRIIYRSSEHEVEIVAVVHTARLLRRPSRRSDQAGVGYPPIALACSPDGWDRPASAPVHGFGLPKFAIHPTVAP